MDKNDKINVTEKVIDFNSIDKTNNTTLSDEAIDQIVKAASDATPQEVINMHNSMDHAEEMSEEDFEPELRNINLDTPYEDLVQGTKNNYNISDKDLFELAKDGSTISDEDIADKLKETTEGMNPEDIFAKPKWWDHNPPYNIITLNEALTNNPSVVISMSYQKIKRMFYNPLTFKKNGASFMDLFFMERPQRVINDIPEDDNGPKRKPGEIIDPMMPIDDPNRITVIDDNTNNIPDEEE